MINLNKKTIKTINLKERELLERFCYEVRFNRKFTAPFYLNTKCWLFNYSSVIHGSNQTVDNMVGFCLDKNSYMKIGKFNFE